MHWCRVRNWRSSVSNKPGLWRLTRKRCKWPINGTWAAKLTITNYCKNSNSFSPGIPHSGSHDGWGSTLGEKIGTAGAFASLQGTPPVSPVHTSSVHVRKRVLKYQRTDDLKSAFGSPAEQGQEQAVFDGPVELQAQFLQGDLALPIELAIEQNKGMKQVEGQQRDQQTGQD